MCSIPSLLANSPKEHHMADPIVVIGGTRGTGKLVVEALLRKGTPVRLLARNPQKARSLFADRVEHVTVDLASPGPDLDAGLRGASGLVFTAGVPPGFASEAQVRAVDFGGVEATVAAARRVGFNGRLVYLTTMGVHQRSWLIGLLDVVKWNILHWRAAAEKALHESGLDSVVVRAGLLTDGPGGSSLEVTRGDRAVSLRTRVSRADVAQVLLAALVAPVLARDFSVVAAHAVKGNREAVVLPLP
jgi:uncharacterized protein YbjT (DUF2867 family)